MVRAPLRRQSARHALTLTLRWKANVVCVPSSIRQYYADSFLRGGVYIQRTGRLGGIQSGCCVALEVVAPSAELVVFSSTANLGPSTAAVYKNE